MEKVSKGNSGLRKVLNLPPKSDYQNMQKNIAFSKISPSEFDFRYAQKLHSSDLFVEIA